MKPFSLIKHRLSSKHPSGNGVGEAVKLGEGVWVAGVGLGVAVAGVML
jgi:hypothetical protein